MSGLTLSFMSSLYLSSTSALLRPFVISISIIMPSLTPSSSSSLPPFFIFVLLKSSTTGLIHCPSAFFSSILPYLALSTLSTSTTSLLFITSYQRKLVKWNQTLKRFSSKKLAPIPLLPSIKNVSLIFFLFLVVVKNEIRI